MDLLDAAAAGSEAGLVVTKKRVDRCSYSIQEDSIVDFCGY
jgi:hypothetical protein